ncbi:MAG: domain, G-beta repeat [Ignavibacteria bacterium]|nr:domain, G-beta repeat [Ignavibacteria bacterium]
MKRSFSIILLAVIFSFCLKSNLSAQDESIKTLYGHKNWVRTVTFSPDERILASASAD